MINKSYLVIPVKELNNLIKNGNFKSTRKIEITSDIEDAKILIIESIKKYKAKTQFCLIEVNILENDIFTKEYINKIKEKLSTVYFMIKNKKGVPELVPFQYPSNEEYISIILKYY